MQDDASGATTETRCAERCAGSDVAIGYTESSGLPGAFPYPKQWCPACGAYVETYSEFVNVRIREHTR